jgi:hypothetical protein
MKKIYKYGFGLLLVSTFTFFNFWQVTKTSCEKDTAKCKEINEKRVSSLMASSVNDKRTLNSFSGKNIITSEPKEKIIKTTTLAILLSDFKCDKCQEKELERLNGLKENLSKSNIEIIGITTLSKKIQGAIQKKTLNLDFQIYWVDDAKFNEISIADEYPQIIYVKNNIIQSGFIPVPMDDEFSEMFFSELLNVLEEAP